MYWAWGRLQFSENKTHAAPDFLVPTEVRARATEHQSGISENEMPPTGRTLDLAISYRPNLGRYAISAFTLTVDDQDEVSGALLRELHPAKDLQDVLDGYVEITLEDGTLFDLRQITDARLDIVSGGPSSDEAMLATARAYRYQQIVGDRAPAHAVQRTLGLTAPTATLWIRRARSLGLLGEHGNKDG